MIAAAVVVEPLTPVDGGVDVVVGGGGGEDAINTTESDFSFNNGFDSSSSGVKGVDGEMFLLDMIY